MQPAKDVTKSPQSTKNEVVSNKVIPSIPKATSSKAVEKKAEDVETMIKEQDDKINAPINSADARLNVTVTERETQSVENKTEISQEKLVQLEIDDAVCGL